LLLVMCLRPPAGVAAQGSAPVDASPPHYLASWSIGAPPLRLSRSAELGQGHFAPAYSDALAGYVFGGQPGRLRHGAGLGLSLNLAHDGGYTEPVLGLRQLVVMPSYLLYWDAHPDLFAVGHFGIPIALSQGATAGAEVGFALGYRLLAGFGTFAEAGLDGFFGATSTLSVLASVEIGVFLDYEALP
jgi:hypothetical protein